MGTSIKSTHDIQDHKTYNLIAKYRKQAMKATFTNPFIKKCLALPDNFEQWVKEGKQSTYEYGVSTGCCIDGKIITLSRISKKHSWLVELFKSNFREGTVWNSWRVPFAGYEMTLSVYKNNDEGFYGALNLEYKDCLNGYYYLLINDESFIGYDKD